MEEDWKHRLERPGTIRWNIVGPVIGGVFALGFLIGLLIGALIW